MDIRQQLQQRFKQLYPGCDLWQVELYKSIFKAWYKDECGRRHVAMLGFSQQEIVVSDYRDEGGNYESENTEKTKLLFEGIDRNNYTDRFCDVISYRNMDFWTSPF